MNSSRRSFLQSLAVGTLAVASSEKSLASEKKPNIIFILGDDIGWGDVGYHGSEIKTPIIDQLAAEGKRFRRHYVAPTCTPTRVGLMTGRYPSRYGVLSPAYGDIFDKDTVTMAAALGDCGYETSISGKWHMGSPPNCLPRKYGFKSSYGYFHGQIDPYTHLYKNGEACWHRNDELLEEKGHATDLITDEAVRVIEASGDKPFFLYVAYSVPHYPLDEPEEWTAMYDGVFEEPSRRIYAASMTHMDHGIGRIMDALKRSGLRERTLVVFSSDNGGQESWQSDEQYHGRYAEKPHTVLGDNLPLRGWKGDVYEGGIRVPALANWPGVLKPGTVKEPIHIVDWMATFCGLAGYKPKHDLKWDGHDIWPLLIRGEKGGKPRVFYWKTPNASAILRDDWKLVVLNKGEQIELYDLSADSCETKDLANYEKKRMTALKDLLTEHAKKDRPRVR